MAATVLSGNGAVAYTNNTGQNVRVIINYFKEIMITSMRLNHLNTQLLGGMVPLHIIPHLIIKLKFLVWEKYSISGYCSGKWSRISNQ